MSKKVDRAVHGPSWAEVILGAALSLALGVVLGAVLLISRPVTVVKTPEKEPARGVVYFVEGSRDASKARQALAKRKAFLEGQSVTVNEEELNALVAPTPGGAPGAPAPKAPEKKDAKGKEAEKGKAATAAGGDAISAGAANFRIDDGKLQVAVPVTIDLTSQKIIVQARGGFEKQGDTFVYVPEKIYFGSCPVERLPFLSSYVREKFTAAQTIPEDIQAAWKKLANVSIEGRTLKLTMP